MKHAVKSLHNQSSPVTHLALISNAAAAVAAAGLCWTIAPKPYAAVLAAATAAAVALTEAVTSGLAAFEPPPPPFVLKLLLAVLAPPALPVEDAIDWVGERPAEPRDATEPRLLTEGGCGGYWYGRMLRGESWKGGREEKRRELDWLKS